MVIGVLALAIGVNTSLFSVAQAVRFGPMPYPGSDRLVVVNETQMSAGLDELMTSTSNFRDWVAEADAFEVLAASNGQGTLVYLEGTEPLRLRANVVSSGYFSLLGAELTMGRYLLPEEDEGWNEHPVVVLSHGLWHRAFGGEEDIVGRGVTLGERPYTVVGVLAPGFHDVDSATHETDAWVPLSMGPHVLGLRSSSNLRVARWLRAFGRLRPGVSREAATTEMETLAARLAEAYPDTNGGHGVRIRPLAELLLGDVRGSILALGGAALFVLLIGCANVANLLLVRAAARRRNYALKRALGMTRSALLRETLSEGLVLSLTGGLVGVVLALIVNARLADWLPVALPAFVDLRLATGALGLAVALSLATGIAFALLPALEFGRDNLSEVLQEGSRSDPGGVRRGRLMRPLVVGELAAAVVLMVGGLLMVRSFEALHDTSLGFETNDLLTLKLDLEGTRFDDSDTLRQFGERLIDASVAVPGIETATLWGPRIPGAATWSRPCCPTGTPVTRSQTRRSHVAITLAPAA